MPIHQLTTENDSDWKISRYYLLGNIYSKNKPHETHTWNKFQKLWEALVEFQKKEKCSSKNKTRRKWETKNVDVSKICLYHTTMIIVRIKNK